MKSCPIWGFLRNPWHKDPYSTIRIQWKVCCGETCVSLATLLVTFCRMVSSRDPFKGCKRELQRLGIQFRHGLNQLESRMAICFFELRIYHPERRWRNSHVLVLSWPFTKPHFGSCAIYFPGGICFFFFCHGKPCSSVFRAIFWGHFNPSWPSWVLEGLKLGKCSSLERWNFPLKRNKNGPPTKFAMATGVKRVKKFGGFPKSQST